MKTKTIFLTLSLAASVSLMAQERAMKPGVTAWVYETGSVMSGLPLLVEGQTPNVSGDFASVSFSGPWETGYGAPLADYFLAKIWGNIVITEAGSYEFRLSSDDGATFSIGTESTLVIDNDPAAAGGHSANLNLFAGSYPFSVDYFQNTGASGVLLEWKPPGTSEFVPVPTTALETEDGLTHVTSPGTKGFYYESGSGGSAGGPGDGRPLAGVHPGFDVINFRPASFHPAVGGMDFLPDGRLAICTWDEEGSVYLLDNLDGPATVKRFATGLGEPLGLKVVDGVIYVTQKQEVTKLIDNDGDDIADEYLAVAHGWPTSFNYHEFSMNLERKDGFLWIATSVPLRTGNTAYLPGSEPSFPVPNGPGSLIKIDPAARTWEIVANGLRTPNGMGLGPDGELFGCDNQGEWVPSSRLYHLRPGAFYGHQLNPGDTEDYTRPVLWMPHGEISNSPAQPLLLPSGPYAGQLLIAELTHGGIKRAFLENVDGQYQGAIFRFTQGLESGMNRLALGPDGDIYAGGLGSGGNWNWKNTTYGLQKLRPNGTTVFEMKTVRVRADGFIIEFTQPVPASVAANPANYLVQQFRYEPEGTYGGPKRDVSAPVVREVLVSQDRRRVFLGLDGMEEDHVTAIRLKDFVNDFGLAPWATEAWYTANVLPAVSGPDFVPLETPLEEQIPVSPQVSSIFEAEDAALNGPQIANAHAGHTGTGFADYGSSVGQTITWTVNATHAGAHDIAFRFANGGTADRPLSVTVNGVVVKASLAFPVTGAWTSWQLGETVTVPLNIGANSIRLTSIQATGPNVDHLEVSGPDAPPEGARILFDGTRSSLDANWVRDLDGTTTNWPVTNGELLVEIPPDPNSISTIESFGDYLLHVEWLSPAGGSGQLGGNSGVKLHRRYEVQILNTGSGIAPGDDLAGSIYQLAAPDANASLGAGQWQSYEIAFTAPRWDGTEKIADARMTVWWNGLRVHTDVAVPGPTGDSPAELPGLQSLLLQAHASASSAPVKFRNIWLQPRDTYRERWLAWLESHGIPNTADAATADFDGDGIPNLWEYADGGNPKLGDAATGESLGRMPRLEFESSGGETYARFRFLRGTDSGSLGLRFLVETSPDLTEGNWTVRDSSVIGTPLPTSDGFREEVVVGLDEPVTETDNLFARLRIEIL